MGKRWVGEEPPEKQSQIILLQAPQEVDYEKKKTHNEYYDTAPWDSDAGNTSAARALCIDLPGPTSS